MATASVCLWAQLGRPGVAIESRADHTAVRLASLSKVRARCTNQRLAITDLELL